MFRSTNKSIRKKQYLTEWMSCLLQQIKILSLFPCRMCHENSGIVNWYISNGEYNAVLSFRFVIFLQIEPIRNFFAALFLASIGMLIHMHFLWSHVDILLAAVILVIVIKTVIVALVVKGFGYNNKTSLLVSIVFHFQIITDALLNKEMFFSAKKMLRKPLPVSFSVFLIPFFLFFWAWLHLFIIFLYYTFFDPINYFLELVQFLVVFLELLVFSMFCRCEP